MRRLVFQVVIGLVICLSISTYAATYGGGSGTTGDPYQIRDPNQMNTIGLNSGDWGKCFKLMSDIDMSTYTGIQYNIIGNVTTKFTGTFDGNGHIIRNLTYTTTADIDYVGLFGYISDAAIQNLGLENVNISTSGDYIGGLVGWNNLGTIASCYADGSICGIDYVGGLSGFNFCGTMILCYAAGTVTGLLDVGGLVGSNVYYSTLNACYATGTISGNHECGGLVGYNYNSTIATCYTTGNITSTGKYIGGLVGYNEEGIIMTCYAAGAVTGSSHVGGLCGYQYDEDSAIFENSFWDIQTSGQTVGYNIDPDYPGMITNVVGKTTVEMKTLSTFTDVGWDFSSEDGDAADWYMLNGDYPRLSWQFNYGGGRGTADEPYQIWTAEQMNTIGIRTQDWDKHFILMADIDMIAYTGMQYNIIGNATTPFTGTFDGDRHVVSNLTFSTASAVTFVGMFGRTANMTIRNLGIEKVNLTAEGILVGGLAGYQYSGSITNCYSTGSIADSSCYNESRAGGLVGWQFSGDITNCYSTVSITASSDEDESYAGGLVGCQESGSITSCYSTGSVTASSPSHSSHAGGLVGCQESGSITSCYSTGPVTAFAVYPHVGGLVGDSNGYFTVSFWDTQTSGTTDGVGNLDPDPSGAAGKTTAQMKTFSTFTAAGWDFVNAWGIVNLQTYPLLNAFSGSINPADINYSGTVDLQDLTILAANWLNGV